MPVTKKEHMYYEVPLLLTFFLTGVAGLFLPRQASSNTLLTMPTELLYVWYGVSTIGGGLGLLGTALRSIPARWAVGNVLLRFGLTLLLLQLVGYGLAVLGLFNLRALFVGAILLAFAWGAGRRVRKITRDLKNFRAALSSQVEGVNGLGDHPPSGRDLRRGGGTDAPVADQEAEGGHREDKR